MENNAVVLVVVSEGGLEGVYTEDRIEQVARHAAQLIRGASDPGRVMVGVRPLNADAHTERSKEVKARVWALIETERLFD